MGVSADPRIAQPAADALDCFLRSSRYRTCISCCYGSLEDCEELCLQSFEGTCPTGPDYDDIYDEYDFDTT